MTDFEFRHGDIAEVRECADFPACSIYEEKIAGPAIVSHQPQITT
jgi:hypothetical protein